MDGKIETGCSGTIQSKYVHHERQAAGKKEIKVCTVHSFIHSRVAVLFTTTI